MEVGLSLLMQGVGPVILHILRGIKQPVKSSPADSGDPVEIGFNNKYLLDALRSAESDEVRLMLNGPISPMLVLPKEGDSFSFLVLPVRLRSEM